VAPVVDSAEQLRVLLGPAAARYRIDLEVAAAPLATYAERLMAWNRRINLTGARGLATLAVEHFADSFPLTEHLPHEARCIDVGSGAGLPGIVLAIIRRDLELTLLEPREKRRAFLSAVVRELDLPVTVLADRLDSHLVRVGRASYDAAISRAVFALTDWLDAGPALVRSGGVVIGLAGQREEAVPSHAERVAYDVGAGPRAIAIVRV